MELLFIAWFAFNGMYDRTKTEFTDWGRRKLDAGRSTIAARRATFRPGGSRRSPRGRARVRDFPARGWWSFADVVWSFCRAAREGAREGAAVGRERYRARTQFVPPPELNMHPEGIDLDKMPDTDVPWDDPVALDAHFRGQTEPPVPFRPSLVPPIPTQASPVTTGGNTMADASTFEQVGVMLEEMKNAALFALDDAQNDLKRANEDGASTEAMVAFCRSITAGPSYETPLAVTAETSAALTSAKQDAVAAAEAHVAAIAAAIDANNKMME